MSPHELIVLGVIVAAVILFISEWIGVDLIALMLVGGAVVHTLESRDAGHPSPALLLHGQLAGHVPSEVHGLERRPETHQRLTAEAQAEALTPGDDGRVPSRRVVQQRVVEIEQHGPDIREEVRRHGSTLPTLPAVTRRVVPLARRHLPDRP